MPMPLFPYAQGDFCRRANDHYADPVTRKATMQAAEARIVKALQQSHSIRDVRDDLAGGNIPTGQKTHFDNHWVPVGGNSPTFPYLSAADVDEVMLEGNLRALRQALDEKNWGDSPCPLPISTLWVCNGTQDQFDAVTVVHVGVVVLLIFSTPPPVEFPGAAHIADGIRVTRKLRSQVAIDDIHDRLGKLGLPPGDVPQSITTWQGSVAQPGDVGTFRLRV